MRQWWFAPAWRPARWGLVFLVVAHLVGINAWAWKLDAAVRDKQQRVNALLTQTFPGVRTVVDAPLQMQRELALLRQASGGITDADMEAMLAALGDALPAGTIVAAIDFAPGELAVRGPELAGPALVALQDKLQRQGYQARVDNGRLIVRRQAKP
jgi:general secretion pathway protein L